MILAIFVLSSLNLAVALFDLWADLRHTKPQRQGATLRDIARMAVAAAERRGGDGPDKLRNATQCVLDLAKEHRIKCTAARADNLVHRALSENES